MTASKQARSSALGRLLCGGALLVALGACATKLTASPDSRAANAVLSEVKVEHEGDATVVSLMGVSEPVFTAFERSDPPRLVVDLTDVEVGEIPGALAVYDGVVEEVVVSPFETGTARHTRVELALSGPAHHDVQARGDRLEIRIAAPAGADAAQLAAADDAEAGLAEVSAQGPALDQATTLLALSAEETSQGTRIRLHADGALSEVDAFALEDPARLVIDLHGVGEVETPGRIEMGYTHAERVRVGKHADKVRVVIDVGDASLPFEQVATEPRPDGLMLHLGFPAGTALAAGAKLIDLGVEPVPAEAPQLARAESEAVAEPLQEAMPELVAAEEPAPEIEIADASEAEAEEPVIVAEADETAPEAAQAEETAGTATETAPMLAQADPAAVEDEATALAEPSDAADEVPAALADEAAGVTDGWQPEPGDQGAALADVPAAAGSEDTANEGNRVYGVQLDSQSERERVAILSQAPIDYDVVELDAETMLVRIHGASIDPDAAVRLAPAQAGPLSLVTAFQQPDVAMPEVRVVVKRAAGIEPVVSQQGTMLFLDFPRSGSSAAELPVQAAEAAQAAAALPLPPAPAPAKAPAKAPAPAASKAVAQAQADLAPAAIDPDSGLGMLQEGGLIEGKSYVGRRISLDFKDVDIADVLRLIADVSDLNIVAGDDVDGKVTIRLVDVPWDQALDVILLTKGLGFVRVGNVLRIAPSNLLKEEEEARLQERRAKEKLEDLVVKLQPVNYANVKEVSKMVKRLLTARGSVDVDERTNTVILKDIAAVIDEATALIKAIDTQTPQVLIEAKIVEARLDFSREIGSTWAFGAQPFVDGFDAAGGARRDLGLGDDVVFHNNSLLTGFTDTFNHVQVANPITSVANGLLDVGAFLLDEQFNLELRLEAAESSGDGKVISSPRVVTLDNREAEIEQGVSIPFQTFEGGDAQLEFIDAVLKLKVTPHITADRSIIMRVEVQRNAPDDSVQTPTGSPAIAKNEAKTETLVKDGQTLVIGGIYVVSKADRRSGVPFFNKIPILGAAFRNTEVRDQRNELLIFVTPRIVVSPGLAG